MRVSLGSRERTVRVEFGKWCYKDVLFSLGGIPCVDNCPLRAVFLLLVEVALKRGLEVRVTDDNKITFKGPFLTVREVCSYLGAIVSSLVVSGSKELRLDPSTNELVCERGIVWGVSDGGSFRVYEGRVGCGE